jgi:Ala-tRNA(Pro) deacylase
MSAKPAELFALLDEMGIETSTVEHEPVFTVEESESVTAGIPGGHTKNLFLKDKKDNFFLLVAEHHARIPLNKIHGQIGAQGRVSFANSDWLMKLLGVEPGSVNAFAPMNDQDGKVQVIIDQSLLPFDKINCHPLTNTMTTTISLEDLLRFLEDVGHPAEILSLSVQGDSE